MENANSPFDGIFSLMLLLRRSSPEPGSRARPSTSSSPYSTSFSIGRSDDLTPPPSEITLSSCRPGHPADSFQRSVSSDRILRRRSKWSWSGRSASDEAEDAPPSPVAAVSPVHASGPGRKRMSVARIMTWSSSSGSPQYAMERDTYMSERARARHTMAMDRKLPRVHEAHLEEEDDEEQHNAVVQREGLVDDEIRVVKRDRALAALETSLPLRRNSEGFDNLVEMTASMGSMQRGTWDGAWSPL